MVTLKIQLKIFLILKKDFNINTHFFKLMLNLTQFAHQQDALNTNHQPQKKSTGQ